MRLPLRPEPPPPPKPFAEDPSSLARFNGVPLAAWPTSSARRRVPSSPHDPPLPVGARQLNRCIATACTRSAPRAPTVSHTLASVAPLCDDLAVTLPLRRRPIDLSVVSTRDTSCLCPSRPPRPYPPLRSLLRAPLISLSLIHHGVRDGYAPAARRRGSRRPRPWRPLRRPRVGHGRPCAGADGPAAAGRGRRLPGLWQSFWQRRWRRAGRRHGRVGRGGRRPRRGGLGGGAEGQGTRGRRVGGWQCVILVGWGRGGVGVGVGG